MDGRFHRNHWLLYMAQFIFFIKTFIEDLLNILKKVCEKIQRKTTENP